MRNAHAKALANPLYHQRKVAARKGRGSYKRNSKHAKQFNMDVR